MKTKTYTVAAVYEDNRQRFACAVEATSPGDAIREINEAYPGLIIAGVFEGKHTAVDISRLTKSLAQPSTDE